MKIGDTLTWRGHSYVLRGVEPMSLPGRRAELEDPINGARLRVPLAELEPAAAKQRRRRRSAQGE